MDKMFLAVKRHGQERPYLFINIANAIGFQVTDSGTAMKMILPEKEVVLVDILPEHISMTYAQMIEIFTKIVIDGSLFGIDGNNQFTKRIEKICKDCGSPSNLFDFKDGILKLIL